MLTRLGTGAACASVLLLIVATSAGWTPQLDQDPLGERLENRWMREHLRDFPPDIVEEGPEMSAEFYESLRTLTLWRLAETLDLGEEELVHFFPRFNELEKARHVHRAERAALAESMEAALATDDLKQIKEAIDSFRKARDRFQKQSRELEDDLLEVLTLEQQARYLIFMETIAPEIEGMLRALHQLRS